MHGSPFRSSSRPGRQDPLCRGSAIGSRASLPAKIPPQRQLILLATGVSCHKLLSERALLQTEVLQKSHMHRNQHPRSLQQSPPRQIGRSRLRTHHAPQICSSSSSRCSCRASLSCEGGRARRSGAGALPRASSGCRTSMPKWVCHAIPSESMLHYWEFCLMA